MTQWERMYLFNHRTGEYKKLGQLHIIDNEFWSNIDLHFEEGGSTQMSLHAFMVMVMGGKSFNGLYSLFIRPDDDSLQETKTEVKTE